MRERLDHVGAAAGILYPVLIFLGLGLAGGADLTSTNAEIARFLRGVDVARFVAGSYAVVVAMLCLVIFAARLRTQLRGADAEGFWLPDVVLSAATLSATAHALGTAAPGPAIVRHEGSDLQLAAFFVRLGPLLHWVAEAAMALVLVAAGLEILRRREILPAWLGWSGCVIGLALVATVPIAATGITHVPATLGGVWVLATGIAMIRRPASGVQATASPTSDTSYVQQARRRTGS
jgi:hypothetical protein